LSIAKPCLIVVPAGKVGHERLCRGVAERLQVDADVVVVARRSLADLLAPRRRLGDLMSQARQPERRLLLASGRRAVLVARAIAALPPPRPFVAALGASGVATRHFDFVWTSVHDRLKPAPNVLATLTTPHQLTAADLAVRGAAFAAAHAELPRPWIAVLIGGPNGAFRFGDAETAEIATALTTLANSHGGSLLVTASRRTGQANRRRLAERLAGAPVFFWDGGGDNPLAGMLGAADFLVVTCDSINMVSEAVSTGKPVYLWPLPGGSAKFDRFHEGLQRHGAVRWFDGGLDRWRYDPVDATLSVAEEIARRLGGDGRTAAAATA